MTLETTKAALAEEQAKLQTATQEVEVAQANVATIQTRIDDATLTSPVIGRVLYRLAEPGEVLAAGGKALTLVNLEDVYMEIFLPSAAGRRREDRRGRADHRRLRARTRRRPGYVSFVSPEAQFTPKQVETQSEREKLMFRVKIQVPQGAGHALHRAASRPASAASGTSRWIESAVWPAWLQST